MKNLTEIQKEFILVNFFKNEKIEGWKRIGNILLEKGECVVAGDRCVWSGGIGNFIKTENSEDFFGYLKYIFDLDYFMSSGYFKSITRSYIQTLNNKKFKLDQELNDITSLSYNTDFEFLELKEKLFLWLSNEYSLEDATLLINSATITLEDYNIYKITYKNGISDTVKFENNIVIQIS